MLEFTTSERKLGKRTLFSVLFPYFNVCGTYYLTEAVCSLAGLGAWALSLMIKLASDWFRAWMLLSDWSQLTSDDRAKKVAKEFLNETGSQQKGPVKTGQEKKSQKIYCK